MIIDIVKDYSVNEIANFAQEHPDRYDNLCKIVGEFALGARGIFLAIILPYKNDTGCVAVSTSKNKIINIVGIRYF